HVLLGLLAELGLVAHRGAQDVARRVVRQLEIGLQPLALSALPGAGRAEEYEVQLGHGAAKPNATAQTRHPEGLRGFAASLAGSQRRSRVRSVARAVAPTRAHVGAGATSTTEV